MSNCVNLVLVWLHELEPFCFAGNQCPIHRYPTRPSDLRLFLFPNDVSWNRGTPKSSNFPWNEASSYWGTTIFRNSHHFSSISVPMFLPTKRLRGKPRHGSASSGSPVSRQPSRRWPEELVSPRRKISGEPWSRDLRQLNGDTMKIYTVYIYRVYIYILFYIILSIYIYISIYIIDIDIHTQCVYL